MSSGYVSAAERPLILRIVNFPLVALVVAVLLYLFANAFGIYLGRLVPPLGDLASLVVQTVIGLGLVLATYKLAIARLGEQPRDDLCARGALRAIGQGFVGGALLYAAIVAVAAALGIYRITGNGDVSRLVQQAISAALVPAIIEEILFRGILFRWIEEFAGTWAGLIISSALFGLAHILNPGATWFSSFCISVEAGLLLGGAYMLTRSLWMPIGLHFAWNFVQGAVFGLPVSGHPASGLVRAELQGPAPLSGGAFGLEASVIALVIASIAGIWLIRRAVRRGLVVMPRWVRRRTIAGI